MNRNGKLVLVRHGESTWNSEGRFAGATDVPLTAQGIEQARSAGALIKKEIFDIVFTSTLQRAMDTLDYMRPEMDCHEFEIRRSDKLNERNFGLLEGQLKDDLAAVHGEDQIQRWRFGWDEPMPDGIGERFAEMWSRVVDFYESEIAPQIEAGKNVLIVAHGQVLRAISMYLEAAEADRATEFMMENAQPRTYRKVDAAMLRE